MARKFMCAPLPGAGSVTFGSSGIVHVRYAETTACRGMQSPSVFADRGARYLGLLVAYPIG
jgi:hypothetical protein